MFSQLARQDESDRCLDLSRGDGGFLVVGGQFGSFCCDALKDVCQNHQLWMRRGQDHDIPLTKEFKMDMARLEIPVSGWTCLRTADNGVSKQYKWG